MKNDRICANVYSLSLLCLKLKHAQPRTKFEESSILGAFIHKPLHCGFPMCNLLREIPKQLHTARTFINKTNNLLNSSEDEYLLAVANSYTTKINEELNSDLELLRAIDIEALIEQHDFNRPEENVEAEENPGFIPENAEEPFSEEEINVDDFIDILNKSDSIIVISNSSSE